LKSSQPHFLSAHRLSLLVCSLLAASALLSGRAHAQCENCDDIQDQVYCDVAEMTVLGGGTSQCEALDAVYQIGLMHLTEAPACNQTIEECLDDIIGTIRNLMAEGSGRPVNCDIAANSLHTDQDDDGLTDYEEIAYYGTDPFRADTDNDLLADAQEVLVFSTNPLALDTDNDGTSDVHEILDGTNPLDPTQALTPLDFTGAMIVGGTHEAGALLDDNGEAVLEWNGIATDQDAVTVVFPINDIFAVSATVSDPAHVETLLGSLIVTISNYDPPAVLEITVVIAYLDGTTAVKTLNLYAESTMSDPQADPDGDGLSNLLELLAETDPGNSDSDDGGIDDRSELLAGKDPNFRADDKAGDLDSDGFSDQWENLHATQPADAGSSPLENYTAGAVTMLSTMVTPTTSVPDRAYVSLPGVAYDVTPPEQPLLPPDFIVSPAPNYLPLVIFFSRTITTGEAEVAYKVTGFVESIAFEGLRHALFHDGRVSGQGGWPFDLLDTDNVIPLGAEPLFLNTNDVIALGGEPLLLDTDNAIEKVLTSGKFSYIKNHSFDIAVLSTTGPIGVLTHEISLGPLGLWFGHAPLKSDVDLSWSGLHSGTSITQDGPDTVVLGGDTETVSITFEGRLLEHNSSAIKRRVTLTSNIGGLSNPMPVADVIVRQPDRIEWWTTVDRFTELSADMTVTNTGGADGRITATIDSITDPADSQRFDGPSRAPALEEEFVAGEPKVFIPLHNSSETMRTMSVDIDATVADAATDDRDETTVPSRFVPIHNADTDNDGIPDRHDNDGSAPFIPLQVQVSPAVSDTAMIRFVYPKASTPVTAGAPFDPGTIRLWTADGNELRNPNDVLSSGNFISHGTAYPLSAIGGTFYIEGIRPDIVAGGSVVTVEVDPDGLSGALGYVLVNKLAFTVVNVDLDADSDNRDGFENSAAEEAVEMAGSGKMICVNDGDADGDLIPDYAEVGLTLETKDANQAGARFTPVSVRFSNAIDLFQAEIRLTYAASNPSSGSVQTAPYTRPSGQPLRIWTRDGDQQRTGTTVTTGGLRGHFIAAGTAYNVSDLFSSAEQDMATNLLTLFVEGVLPARNEVIALQVDLDGSASPFALSTFDEITVTSVDLKLIPDHNRDRIIDTDDEDLYNVGSPFYFWLNDDNDDGVVLRPGRDGRDDLPGDTPHDHSDTTVDGERDLIDFAPLQIRLNPASILNDPTVQLRLRTTEGRINIVYTNLFGANSADYLEDLTTSATLGSGTTVEVGTGGITLSAAFRTQVQTHGEGVLLFEGCEADNQGFVLEVVNNSGTICVDFLPVRMNGVESMFRHVDIRSAAGGSGGHPPRDDAPNFPDCVGCTHNLIFIHGYNVGPVTARGSQAEIFKRLYWSGSTARYYGVTWRGNETQVNLPYIDAFTTNYAINIENALDSGPALSDFVQAINEGGTRTTTAAAHSMGSVIAAGAIANFAAPISRFYMINAAFALEALDPSARNQAMIHNTWRDVGGIAGNDYDPSLFAANWYQFFPTDDARSELTWQGRFTGVLSINVHNFYSQTENVLNNFSEHWESGDLTDLGGNPWNYYPSANLLNAAFGPTSSPLTSVTVLRYPWGTSELLKGRHNIVGSNLGGSTKMGWRFNTFWGSLSPTDANNVFLPAAGPNTDALRTEPFFRKQAGLPIFTSIKDLFKPGVGADSTGSVFAEAHHNLILAKGIPALSFSVSSNPVLAGGVQNIQMDFAIQNSLVGWPIESESMSRHIWRHADFKNVAYVHTFQVYDRFVTLGGF